MLSGGFIGLAGLALSVALVGGTAVNAQDSRGVVAVECDVKPDGYFEHCRVLSEPEGGGYGQIALARAAPFRVAVPPEGIEAGTRINFNVSVEAPLPESLRPSEDDPRPGVIVVPDWLQAPVVEFPERALVRRVEGQARVRCVAASDGALAGCEVLSQDPVGAGFGPAVLAAVAGARLSPEAVAAARPGAVIEINYNFVLPD